MNAKFCTLLVLVGWGFSSSISFADEFELHNFKSMQLTDTYYSEGVNIGDINHDGIIDVVHGPYWFQGPDYKFKHEIYRPLAQPRQKYADNFFSWVYDFDGDGWNDVFVVGFPGTPAHVYENPAKSGFDAHWKKHEVFDWVSNEAPHFVNLVGDERPELVCTRDGYFGYATIDWENPFRKWLFHIVSEQTAPKRFGHGLGVGDVDGDGRLDLITKVGWFQQPESVKSDPQWDFHPVKFAAAGGAEMHVYDVDGDGDNDIITSLAAHEFGLAWHEQYQDGDGIAFRQHLIMGRTPEENRYGVVFTELHTVQLADIDGDGLKDIVTGKTYWSHHMKSSMWDAGAVVYWFKLVRNKDGVDWIPYKINDEAGVGRQVIVGDVNADKLPDIIIGGMKGLHVLIHEKERVDEQVWRARQPKPIVPLKSGLSPEAAAAHMTTLDGFRVQLAAGEPQVHQPIAFTIDERGRLWVAEAYNYPLRAAEGQGKDKIVILEDTNQDGTLDSRKVFIEGLNLVSGLEVGFGGVWVGAAPYLMFIPDENGDDVPDEEPRILLDGFGYEDTHETLNSFIWGPDGWLYGCHGVFTYSRVGPPGMPDNQRTPMNAGVWRYHPTRHKFEVFAWGTSNPWGIDFNDYGQAFITACVIPHLWHMIQGGSYHRQGGRHFNPYLFDDIKTIADHEHFVGNIRDHAWWGGREPKAPKNTLQAGGGHAHCGAMVYLGDNWPDRYRNQIFMNNIHGNRVNVDFLHRRDSGYIGRHGEDILLANDQWYRGINLKYGPNGSVYLTDWYDRNACHRRDPSIWDRSNGRIFNLAYGNPQTVSVDLAKLTDAELVKMQLHGNDWYVRMARRLLQHRAAVDRLDAETRPALVKIFRDHPDVTRKLRALWALHVIGGLTADFRIALLNHANEYVRAWVVQFELEDHTASHSFVNLMTEMAKSDPSPVVRLYLASAAIRLPTSQRWPLVEALARHGEDASDHNLPLMYWYAIEPLVTQDASRALALAKRSEIPLLTQYVIRRAASDKAGLELVVASIAETDDARSKMLYLDEMLHAFEGRANIPVPASWAMAYKSLAANETKEVRDRADQVAVILGDARVYPKFRTLLVNGNSPIEERQQALDVLVRGRDKDAAASYQKVLSEPALRGPALRALSRLADSRTPTAVLGIYDRLTDNEKRDAIATLASRPSYARELLDSIESGKIPGTDLHAYHVRQLFQFGDEELNRRINEVWGEVRETSHDTKAAIARYASKLGRNVLARADVANGRRLYDGACASCHTLFGEGGKVGPDITGSDRANLDYILENLLAPSAVLGKEYRMTVIFTMDGRVISGVIQKETDSAVTLRTINDTVVVAKDDIEERRLSDLSVMPEGQLDLLKPAEVRDLIAYLASPSQVAPRGPRAPIDSKTNRVAGAIEGESMKIVLKSAGNARNQKMDGFAKDRWSGGDHLFWSGGKTGEILELAIEVEKTGFYDVEIVLTKARDYGIVQLKLNDEILGNSIDLYNAPDVITTGVLTFPERKLNKGSHILQVTIVGAHPKAIKAFMFGLDYVRLLPSPTTE